MSVWSRCVIALLALLIAASGANRRYLDDAPMVRVPAGAFLRGTTETRAQALRAQFGDFFSGEAPQQSVYLDGYLIDMYEVTNRQYARFLRAVETDRHRYCHAGEPPGKSHTPTYWRDPRLNGPAYPVTGVDWYDAYAYCRWAGKQLPTEAQWEKAARGVDGREYPWGDAWRPAYSRNVESTLGRPIHSELPWLRVLGRLDLDAMPRLTLPVGSFPLGVSPYGAHDMAGNVWEWCRDSYRKHYDPAVTHNPRSPRHAVQSPAGRGLEQPSRQASRRLPQLRSAHRPARGDRLSLRPITDLTGTPHLAFCPSTGSISQQFIGERTSQGGKKRMSEPTQLDQRLQSLETHLAQENPILLQAVASFRKLDQVARRLGFLQPEESFATRISWWPLIAVLGTYSSGKSTFINHYLGQRLQLTGNQAVDDRFTVVCYSQEEEVRVLPGLALDADARFPFYQMSRAIEGITTGEGRRIDAYLQLKTCPSERMRGKILIDSPGFDADAQRTATLQITNHIIDLSDLVLVFFDARHPESGTMHDTLEHLVEHTINRPDSSKFLYILNQIDTTAREDNPEDVIASWQRALAQKGLTAGRFYRIYNPDAAVPIEDDNLRRRFESKRDTDLADIHARMRQVEIDRAYRIIAVLEQTAHDMEERIIPTLQTLLEQWRQRVMWLDGIVFGAIIASMLGATLWSGEWQGWAFSHPVWSALFGASAAWQLVALIGPWR